MTRPWRLIICATVVLGFAGCPARADVGFDRPGGDYDKFTVKSGDPSECSSRCERDARCRAWAAQLSWERSTARMAELVGACARAGTTRGSRDGAWVVSPGAHGEVVAEGPVLDALVASGGKVLRPATATERLLGEVASSPGPP